MSLPVTLFREKTASSLLSPAAQLFPCEVRDESLNPVRMRNEQNSPLPSMDAHLLTKVGIPHVRRSMAQSEPFIQAWIVLTWVRCEHHFLIPESYPAYLGGRMADLVTV